MGYYTLFKLIHILAVIVFMGNIFTGLFWMYRANRTSNLNIIHHTMKNIILSDKYFTIPGVIIILIGGFGAALQNHLPMLRTGWIFWPIILFTVSGIAFSWKVAPLQRKISALTSLQEDGFDWVHYRRLYRQWDTWGIVAIITPVIALVMMVLKWPALSILVK
ncbi:MAG: DUF2269 family protein [Cyclobacteriaceae bacterium]|nr:DUF2269 family protein [Cyclobacteriaceae bacterium]